MYYCVQGTTPNTLIVIESNSRQFPTKRWVKNDETVVTIKWATANTDYLCARHISHKRKQPFLCYKWNPPMGERGGKFDHIERDNLWQADWEKWDDHYRSFGGKHPDPSSGACAVYCVVERWQPENIGLIGFDYVLDNNTGWIHDARAELKSIESIVNIIDLRTPRREEEILTGVQQC